MMELPVGQHVILELFGCRQDLLRQKSAAEEVLKEAARRGEFTVLGSIGQQFDPEGVTAMALLAESHITIHTWPEFRYAAVDVFTCGDRCKPRKACDYLAEELEAEQHVIRVLPRGMMASREALQHAAMEDDARPDQQLWLSEHLNPADLYVHGVDKVLVHERSKFQDIMIVRSRIYGDALILDGQWQSSVGDEFLYHEPIVHVAAATHGAPRNVLIIGGGEGATLREALKWKTVERAVMVDIDGKLVDCCREHLPQMHQGAFDDPRAEVVIGDGLKYLEENPGRWDVLISDISDPLEEGPAGELFTREYYQLCQRSLAPNGLLAVQAGSLNPPELTFFARVFNTIDDVFERAAPVQSFVSIYASAWGFIVAGDRRIRTRPNPEQIDALLDEKVDGDLRMFDGTTMLGMLQPHKHVRRAIEQERRIYTLAQPPKYMAEV